MRQFVFFIGIIFLASCSRDHYAKFVPIYKQFPMSDVPTYSSLYDWAAHPDLKDPSDSVPKDLIIDYKPNQVADVFFIHPTSYLDRTKPSGWSASLKDNKINIYTDYTSILNQASVFNEVGRIYAPRYRQAHIESYYPITSDDSTKAIVAFEIAYQDIKNAFEYYLKYYHNGRPIILAAHSQGSTHAIRLLKEYFDAKPLSKKLVAAYVLGMAIDPNQFTQLKACDQPEATGCILAWRTYQEGYIPPFIEKEKFNSIVTNPLSWNKFDTLVSRTKNEGAVLYNFEKVRPNVVGAINHGGVLWTSKPRFVGNFLIRTKNYHVADYNFYYVSIRKNLTTRVNAYLNNNKVSSY